MYINPICWSEDSKYLLKNPIMSQTLNDISTNIHLKVGYNPIEDCDTLVMFKDSTEKDIFAFFHINPEKKIF